MRFPNLRAPRLHLVEITRPHFLHLPFSHIGPIRFRPMRRLDIWVLVLAVTMAGAMLAGLLMSTTPPNYMLK